MKLRILLLALCSLLLAACSSVEEQMISALFRNYVNAQEALASDNLQGARQALLALTQEPNEEVKTLAKEVADCEDIETARKKFKELSAVVTEMTLPEGLVVAYCPMADEGKGANWVQSDGEIRNPYFGAKMLGCGEITKKP